jgi:hypothetical protein
MGADKDWFMVSSFGVRVENHKPETDFETAKDAGSMGKDPRQSLRAFDHMRRGGGKNLWSSLFKWFDHVYEPVSIIQPNIKAMRFLVGAENVQSDNVAPIPPKIVFHLIHQLLPDTAISVAFFNKELQYFACFRWNTLQEVGSRLFLDYPNYATHSFPLIVREENKAIMLVDLL